MDVPRLLECLAADFARLRAVASTDLAATVPTCPDWTVADLARHVGQAYLQKTVTMREGAEPDPWPPAGLADEEPLALLDRTYADLLAEFAAHEPEDPADTWYAPDRSVRFLIRRMAQETVIHRIDAELATGRPIAPIPADLAVDGIDELLKVYVSFSVRTWGDSFTEILADSPGRTYAVRTDDASWHVRTGPGRFTVEDGADEKADVTISGAPADVLRWVWNRTVAGEPSGVTVDGATEAVEELRRCIAVVTR
ncbi:maleylpyruvate isomerase family mycothiol-dependent enzyme [Kitasatospora sp. NBC_00070]|uniref:maleylpyruvate isomerase family mycothiol-dependent enzyme n=1 Tax=Kitasatospora sp. NBC_00070 TaxID=2975962 RepID=UPI003254046D